MKYKIYTRNWWRMENGQKVGSATEHKSILGHSNSESEARAICKKWNESNKETELGRRAEYSSSY